MAADDTAHHARVAEVIESARLAVTLTSGVDEVRSAGRPGLDEAPFERQRHFLREADADKAARGDRVPIEHDARRLVGSYHLVALRRAPWDRCPGLGAIGGLLDVSRVMARLPSAGVVRAAARSPLVWRLDVVLEGLSE